MPLVLSVIQDELYNRLFHVPPMTVQECVDAWAESYGIFVAGALGCGTPPAPGAITAAKTRLKNVLTPVLLVSVSPVDSTAAFELAFMAFWTGFTFVGAPVAVPGTPTLAAAMALLWASNPLLTDSRLAADLHGALLRTWSLTVVCGLPCNAPIV